MALDLHGDTWSGGALAGTMPDAASFAPSVSTTEAGLWVQRHNAPGSMSQGAFFLDIELRIQAAKANSRFVTERNRKNAAQAPDKKQKSPLIRRAWECDRTG